MADLAPGAAEAEADGFELIEAASSGGRGVQSEGGKCQGGSSRGSQQDQYFTAARVHGRVAPWCL